MEVSVADLSVFSLAFSCANAAVESNAEAITAIYKVFDFMVI
jgi:hypothetical protein